MDMEPAVQVDEQIGPAILSIFDKADKDVVLISPWIKLWGHAEAAMQRAKGKGKRVRCLVREGPDGAKPEQVRALLALGAEVFTVPDLHAKIYMNESMVVMGSMNFYNHSAENSREIAIVINDVASRKAVRDYVNDRLVPVAKPWSENRAPAPAPPSYVGRRGSETELGACIRCARPADFNTDKPLCPHCYESWAEHQNPDYPEKYCHSCGKRKSVTYAKPLCSSCYKSG